MGLGWDTSDWIRWIGADLDSVGLNCIWVGLDWFEIGLQLRGVERCRGLTHRVFVSGG